MGAAGSPYCDAAKQYCEASICNPICLRLTWSAEVTVTCGGANPACDRLSKELKHPGFQKGIQGQLVAAGCDKLMGCCPKSNIALGSVARWSLARTYGGFYPRPATMVHACDHDMHRTVGSAALCAMCKGGRCLSLLFGVCYLSSCSGSSAPHKASVLCTSLSFSLQLFFLFTF